MNGNIFIFHKRVCTSDTRRKKTNSVDLLLKHEKERSPLTLSSPNMHGVGKTLDHSFNCYSITIMHVLTSIKMSMYMWIFSTSRLVSHPPFSVRNFEENIYFKTKLEIVDMLIIINMIDILFFWWSKVMSTVYTRTMVSKLKFEENAVLACFLHLIF